MIKTVSIATTGTGIRIECNICHDSRTRGPVVAWAADHLVIEHGLRVRLADILNQARPFYFGA